MVNLSNISGKLKSDGKYWVTFIGDSITSCEWVHPNWREITEYVVKNEVGKFSKDWMLSSWGMRFFNFAYDGATTKDIVDRLSDIKTTLSNLFIVMIGANDYHKRMPLSDHKENVEAIIRSLKDSGAEVVFSTNNCPDRKETQELYEPYVNADREMNLDNFINLYRESKGFPADKIYTFKFEEGDESEGVKEGDRDFWHPNRLGNAYIAKVILKKVFDLDFDPELYISTSDSGEKYPKY